MVHSLSHKKPIELANVAEAIYRMAGCPLHFQGRFHEGNCRERQDYPGKSRGIDLENLVGKLKTEIKNGHKEIRSKYEISGRFLI